MTFERARTKEQFDKRRQAIMAACENLYFSIGYEKITFKKIAEQTQISRPAIYSYYRVKDDIFLDLLSHQLTGFITTLNEKTELAGLDKKSYAEVLTQTAIKHDKLLALFSILFTNLEQNASMDCLVDFKKDIHLFLENVTKNVHLHFPQASSEEVNHFITSFFAFISGLYPITHISNRQKEAIKQAGIPHVPNSFEDLCLESTRQLLAGLSS